MSKYVTIQAPTACQLYGIDVLYVDRLSSVRKSHAAEISIAEEKIPAYLTIGSERNTHRRYDQAKKKLWWARKTRLCCSLDVLHGSNNVMIGRSVTTAPWRPCHSSRHVIYQTLPCTSKTHRKWVTCFAIIYQRYSLHYAQSKKPSTK